MAYLILWCLAALIIGAFGSDTRFGFFGMFFISLLLSPLIAIIVYALSPEVEKTKLQVGGSTADELLKFKQLHKDGVINDQEYEKHKKRLLQR